MSFDPYNCTLKIRESIWDSNSQHWSSLGSVRVHSLTLFALPGACDVTPGSLFWPATLQPFALVTSPRLKLGQIQCLANAWSSDIVPHNGGRSHVESWMNGPTWPIGISISWIGGLSIAWTLPSNKSKPWGSLKNLGNNIKLLDFPTCPPMKVTSKKALWLSLAYHPCW
jgi:hypothetical protein